MDAHHLNESARDAYERVARAIVYLETHCDAQPSLAELARVMGLSPSHAQRTFQRWAGISPKRFVQYLTADYAQELFDRAEQTILDTAWDVGLSGTGRLHDLFTAVHAMTPGEWKREGRGVELRFGRAPTPLGDAWIASTPRGVCELHFGSQEELEIMADDARSRWPGAVWIHDPQHAQAVADHLFQHIPFRGGLALHLKGTNFQIKVWRALLDIPPGAAVSYGALAHHIGSPKAARAVGSAVGSNLIGYAVPCHRVLRASGAFHHYRWGRVRKRAALVLDATRRV